MALLAFGCGGDDSSSDDMGASGTSGEGFCGDGEIDPLAGEQCEPTLKPLETCESMGYQRIDGSAVLCDATCKFVLMCGNALNTNTGGNGGGGAGG